ncbi:MAG: hypothetical protein KDB18_13830 [Salinibacterium sp.]|nr:hypothetical protein [Salinibacterium sp.]
MDRITSNEILKVDAKKGLVFGFAIVCKVDGKDYYDLQKDHIPEDVMLDAAIDFAMSKRVACDMHERDDKGQPVEKGTAVFLFPLTTEIAKAFGIETKKTGKLCALKPSDPKVVEKFEKGEYTGFSIGGQITNFEEAPDEE